jgi:hypothetical protein
VPLGCGGKGRCLPQPENRRTGFDKSGDVIYKGAEALCRRRPAVLNPKLRKSVANMNEKNDRVPAVETPRTDGTSRSDIRNNFLDKQMIGRRMIRDAADYVSQHIRRQPPVQRLFSFMPTMLTRVSPFHFRSRGKFKDWPLVRLDSGDVNAWGRMRVVGELLIIFDETVLFGLLSLMTRYRNDAFETTLKELCQLGSLAPTDRNASHTWKSIQRLAGTRIDLELTSGSGKKQKQLKEMTGSILSFSDLDSGSGRLRVAVNPYFIEMYAESFVTNIDLKFRSALKNDVSKALYRFFQGQYEPTFSIEIGRLARAVNLDHRLPVARLREKVRSGLNELAESGYLTGFELTADHRINLQKAADAALDLEVPVIGPGLDALT